MRTRKGSALLAATVTVGMAALGLSQTASAATTTGAPTVIDVTSMSQIPTTHSKPAGQAVASVTYRVTMRNNHGGQCLDGDLNGIGNNGAKVQLWGCNGWDNQTWIWVPDAARGAGWYTILNAHGGQCLDGDLGRIGTNGDTVWLWSCNNWDNQAWGWNGSVLVNRNGGQCLDGDLGRIGTNGDTVWLWGCNGWDNQAWKLYQA
ncbi:RICIN domain-containing protein [Kitasatospora griseola]